MTRSHQSTDNSDFNVKTTIFEDSTRQYFLVSRNFPVLMAMWGAKTNRPQKWGKICSKNLKLQNQLQHKRKCPSSLIAQDGWKGDILFSNDLGKFSEVQWQSFYGQPSMFAQVKNNCFSLPKPHPSPGEQKKLRGQALYRTRTSAYTTLRDQDCDSRWSWVTHPVLIKC